MAGRKSNTPTDFWANIEYFGPVIRPDLGPCWIWAGGRDGGYGRFRLRLLGERSAHRIAWILAYGPIPASKPCVLHHCDNPPCVRPDHLHVGTNRQNIEERHSRGRSARGDRSGARLHPEKWHRGDDHHNRKHPERMARGERNGFSKLTEDAVRDIRRRRAEGETLRSIAADHNVNLTCVHKIVMRESWKHVH